ncbi:MAG: ribosome-associated translation inhibitor RaiA [Candidatus Pacebacteria bacterium]|jgi:ribosomal subunit interface protein|nr:ribosomal subunit interface protein [Parcubacteria group bacterium]MDP6249312.1 ribosome-associated translation inhibitor RaiA [Candidatus Paceibacterota bacterium]MDP7159448.1 ribosome-associated translation inhibitor RaiA [Candidatus Paceibacterota bacterium]MDP7365950.1 ribosome-associated translation inhibitor RaiA [Candidatus Paceibacterota bacterium]MDP7466257.1 ribosome-associated translation inhibitor RaiA [Candidatus Paceibacterota bacterium]|tara:strand:- start:402 stop:815 length:414 start_codon:yes stop_codon:yes gene_type:complete
MDTRKNVKTTNIELTPEISDYLDKRLQSIEKLIDRQDTSAMFDVEIGKTTEHHQSGNIFRAEINLHVAGKQMRASAEEATLFNAIDKVEKETMKELRRFKGRQRRLLRKGGIAMKAFMNTLGTGGARIRDFARRRRK